MLKTTTGEKFPISMNTIVTLRLRFLLGKSTFSSISRLGQLVAFLPSCRPRGYGDQRNIHGRASRKMRWLANACREVGYGPLCMCAVPSKIARLLVRRHTLCEIGWSLPPDQSIRRMSCFPPSQSSPERAIPCAQEGEERAIKLQVQLLESLEMLAIGVRRFPETCARRLCSVLPRAA